MEKELSQVQQPRDMLQELIDDYLTRKQNSLLLMKKGIMEKEAFLQEAGEHIQARFGLQGRVAEDLLQAFEAYIFGYSILSPLIDDVDISDIRVIAYDNIRVKRKGRRTEGGVTFASEKEYRRFIDYIATKNQVNISNLNAIQRFTDTRSHPDFILRFTLSMPLLNTYNEPYLCIRKVPKNFPQMKTLVEKGMMSRQVAELLIERFASGSMLICGGNSSGKTTLLNALKETIPDHMSVLVSQQADELTTHFHPDMMFLHSLPGSGESQISYDLRHISIAGLTMDVDYFIIGEIKGAEALYLLNAAYTGQLCAATIHAPSADRAPDKLVDYAMYESRYSRDELMRMMTCFPTLVFMKHFKVQEVYGCSGWNSDSGQLIMTKLYRAPGQEQEEVL